MGSGGTKPTGDTTETPAPLVPTSPVKYLMNICGIRTSVPGRTMAGAFVATMVVDSGGGGTTDESATPGSTIVLVVLLAGKAGSGSGGAGRGSTTTSGGKAANPLVNGEGGGAKRNGAGPITGK
jgi:hypothetical protein